MQTHCHWKSGPARRGLACAAMLVLSSAPASAVEKVRNVVWDATEEIAWSPGQSTTTLRFDADLTALETKYAITSFSINLTRPRGVPEMLARYTVGPLPAGLPAGTSARFEINFSMSCDSYRNRVEIGVGSASISYLHPARGNLHNGVQVEGRFVAASSKETFGLRILDQDGNDYALSLPKDTFHCIKAPEHGTLGVYFDPQGNTCQGQIPAGTVGKVYIVAHTGGNTEGGIAGAEFRFSGVPNGWEVYSVPNPAIVAVGDPFADGVVAGFVCQPPVQGAVLLYTVIVFAHEDINDVQFTILPRDPPLSYACSMMLACDYPVFTKYCVESTSCFVNATGTTICDSPVAVSNKTWSEVKDLYR